MNTVRTSLSICIRIQKHNHHNGIVTFFTPHQGPIKFYINRFFTPQSQWQSIIDIGSEYEITYTSDLSKPRLKSIGLKSEFSPINYKLLVQVTPLLQLLSQIEPLTEEAAKHAYKCIHTYTNNLSLKKESWLRLLSFEFAIIQMNGLSGDLESCNHCNHLFENSETIYLPKHQIEPLCYNCSKHNSSPSKSLNINTLKQLNALYLSLFTSTHSELIDKNTIQYLQQYFLSILRQYYIFN